MAILKMTVLKMVILKMAILKMAVLKMATFMSGRNEALCVCGGVSNKETNAGSQLGKLGYI